MQRKSKKIISVLQPKAVRSKNTEFFSYFFDDIMTTEVYISSDELRTPNVDPAFFQSQKLSALGIPFSFDHYETPMVKRSDLAIFLKGELQPLYDMMKLGGDSKP